MSWRAGAGIRCSPGPYQQTIKHLVGGRACARAREETGSLQMIPDLLGVNKGSVSSSPSGAWRRYQRRNGYYRVITVLLPKAIIIIIIVFVLAAAATCWGDDRIIGCTSHGWDCTEDGDTMPIVLGRPTDVFSTRSLSPPHVSKGSLRAAARGQLRRRPL